MADHSLQKIRLFEGGIWYFLVAFHQGFIAVWSLCVIYKTYTHQLSKEITQNIYKGELVPEGMLSGERKKSKEFSQEFTNCYMFGFH